MSTAAQPVFDPDAFMASRKAATPPPAFDPDAFMAAKKAPPEAQPGGFWHEVVGAVGDMLRGIATGPGIGTPEWTIKTAAQAALADQERKASGRSVPYRAVAGLGENLLGIPASRMEAAANRGDTAGVLGAAAVPTALALAGPVMEGANKFRAARAVQSAGDIENAVKATPEAATAPPMRPAPEPAATAGGAEHKGPAFSGGIAERLGIVDPPPESLMTRAVKPLASNNGWDVALKKAMPDMKAAEAEVGPIEGVDDALQATAAAKKSLWAQYEKKLGAGAGATIDGNSVADAMLKSIDNRTRLQNPGLVKQIQSVADTYRQPMTVEQAEDFLQSANNELHSYYAKNKVGQHVAAKDPATGHVVAEANALRDALYSKLDEVAGPGAADLKQRYGALSNVESELLRRKNVAARQQPVSLPEQLAMSTGFGDVLGVGSAGVAGGPVGAAGALAGKILSRGGNIAVARWLKEYGSADAMITRAFQKLGEKEPSPAAKPLAVPPLAAVGAPQPAQAGNQ